MQVKRYEVSSIHEALIQIKQDLGPDAIILSSKKLNVRGQSVIEVMAARDKIVKSPQENVPHIAASVNHHLAENREEAYKGIREEIRELKEIILSVQKEKSLGKELEELKETMDKFFDIMGGRKRKSSENINQSVYYHLLDCGFSRSSACTILEDIGAELSLRADSDGKGILRVIEEYVARTLPAMPRSREEKRIKAYVGATGVGKTTTLAKLAARYSLMKKKTVGLVTVDTFRIAAIEQLKTYAKIMGIRMEVASTKDSFQKSLQLLADKDMILIDTPGRSCFDDDYANAMGSMIQNNNIETNLLISTTASEDNSLALVDKYSSFHYDNLIITKIDEARRFGILYDVIKKSGKPVSYLTCGQSVPQDIEEFTPQKMASLIMRKMVH